ncbi:Dyp-type peroxidase [uncultured Microbacterium sp.]|uniref:Dyp-type peroxidase n=1 Tax=uncultured Microbacterium sp. TaxID=191216 RepID=UPI0025D28FC7|nr:Dyp-type peroxidase [uncultured Microbacterium sp.]
MTNDSPSRPGVTRRALLVGTGLSAGAAGALGGLLGGRLLDQPEEAGLSAAVPPNGSTIVAEGTTQAGVDRPAIAPGHAFLLIGDIDPQRAAETLTTLGETILRLTRGEAPEITPDGPGDLTVTVGVGERVLAASRSPETAALVSLPEFLGDAELPAARRGGDLLINVNASDPSILEPVAAALTATLTDWQPRWNQYAFRGPSTDGVIRNPFGYHDGIIVPRSADELAENTWIADGPLAGGTICVLRRFRLDTSAFRALPAERRDAVIGRRQADGIPLSGGTRDSNIDLRAKTEAGELKVPSDAHARAAHPSFTGSALMLRRSFSYHDSVDDHGHVFISYQREVETFSRTQLRLDEVDAMRTFVTPTATAAFAILPGHSAASGLGAGLF